MLASHPLSWQEDRIGPCAAGGCAELLRELLRLGYLRARIAREGRVSPGRLAEIVREAPDWTADHGARGRRGSPHVGPSPA
jgi:hypothetical protein